VVIFEKSRAVGGRVATRRVGEFVFDTGATSIATRGMSIEATIQQELDATGLVEIQQRIDVHAGLRVSQGDPRRSTKRYTYEAGINAFAKRLAEGLTIHREVTVDAIERDGDAYRVQGERFDALVLTAPVPQTSLLLWGVQEDRPLANAMYRPCLSVMLGYEAATPVRPYWALIDPEQRHPLNWLSVESAKSPRRAPEGCSAFVAQMGPRFSLEHYGRPDAELIATVASYLSQLFGEPFRHPKVGDVKRWKYSQPETIADFDAVNPAGSRLVIASDGVVGGQIESAFEGGRRCAKLLLVSA
jgi:predicted NAD/FAD-dependent oxidoreductase